MYKYRVIQKLRAHTDGYRSWLWLACWPASGSLYSRCFQTFTLLIKLVREPLQTVKLINIYEIKVLRLFSLTSFTLDKLVEI